MKQIQADRIIVLTKTFCPPAAVVLSNLKEAKAGEVLLIKASRCHAQLVLDLAERMGADVILSDRNGNCTKFWIVKR
ncbi:MAG: hypothetical protein GXO66_01460 [Euryarchaeota archaeon]|nr:hypothetical protein [Euryarchaeota archaeon]